MNYHLVQSCKNTFVLFDHLETGDLDQKLLDEAHLALQNENRDDALLLIKSHSEEIGRAHV